MPSRLPADATPELRALAALMHSELWAKQIYPRLLVLSQRFARDTRETPDDLLQGALVRLYRRAQRGKGPVWDAENWKRLVRKIALLMRSERSKAFERAYARHTVLQEDRPDRPHHGDDDEPDESIDAHPEGTSEDVFRRDRRTRRGDERTEQIREGLDELGRTVFDAILDGTYDPDALAEAHGVDVRQIYLARQRATRHTEKALEASPDSSGPKPAAAESPDRAEAPPKKPLKGR